MTLWGEARRENCRKRCYAMIKRERDTEVLNKKEKGSGKQEDNHIGETVGAQRRGGRVPEPVGMTLHAASDSLAPLVHSSTRLVSNTRVHQAKLT